MSSETVAGAHAFTDEISALMQRLKGHLRDGRLDNSHLIDNNKSVSRGVGFSFFCCANKIYCAKKVNCLAAGETESAKILQVVDWWKIVEVNL